MISVAVFVAVAAISSWFFYSRNKITQIGINNPTSGANVQSQDTIKKVGALMLLPKDETPAVATVNDRIVNLIIKNHS